MAKLVLFTILGGDFKSGFFVYMQIFNEDNRVLIADIEGKLPPAQDLPNYYEDWQYSYRQMVSQRSTRVSLQNTAITNNEIISEIKKAKDNLHFQINNWLKPDGSFSPIWTALLSNLKDENEEIRVIFKTDDIQLRRLPLFTWEIFFEERYHRSEMGLYLPVKSKSVEIKNNQNKVKVLAVLGSTEINSKNTQLKIEKDWEMLKNLLSSESNAEVIPLMNPDLDELADTLDAQRPQILFFAGHSYTEDVKSIGRIVLSETETVTIEDLRFELIKAAKTGLKLAIFNSCNGIGIAQQLYKLQIPNIIVMREPLPDKVAHRFLQRFLEAFAAGKPLNLAVRRAREKLNRLERDFPGVMWLPMIWQNPAEPHLTWESIGGITTEKAVKHSIEENQETQGNNQPSMLWLETQIPQSNPRVIISETNSTSNYTSQSSSVSTNNTFLLLVGRYQITETIGRGRFGQTFLAEDKYLPNRPICVVKQMKVIRPDPSILTIAKHLFETEVKTLYKLGKHDRIPQLLAHCEKDSEFYLVQEFIKGYDLTEEIIPGQPLDETSVIQLLKEILEILKYVHNNNIIHRNIKPTNLMRREQDNQVVMIDFGAVKELSVVSQDNQGKTTITIAVGTPVYMAPEQANGLPKLCSDIYAIGIIAIQAITGLNPQEIRKNQDTGEVIGWENFQISQKLANVLKKMVRYDYKERYKNATEAWQALVDISLKQPKFSVMDALLHRKLLGRYRITQFLGKGGFGETYLAIDMALPDHPQCVVKRLMKNPNPEVLHITRRLFGTEAKTLYKLGQHNNIPQLLAHFEEDGKFYLVQEFIKGHDLTKEIIPGQPLDETSVIQLLKEILEILKYVHKKNIIHRDIKPSNLIRRKQDNQVVMIDFGAVKELSVLARLDNQGERTTTISVGTPVYMAPEQINGHPQLCSDIYAIGIIAIQAITGLDPGKIQKNQTGEVIGWENFQISQKLANVLKKMVRYNYKERYKNATEALEALVDISPKPRKFIVKVMISSVITAIAGISFLLIWRYLKPDLIGNYNQLEKYLKTQDWQKANQETIDIMLKVTKRDSEGYLNANAINNFPCKDLVHLNQLWQDYSQEKFGFSAQKSKYEETGNTIGKYNEKNFNKFGNNVGWQQQGIWISDLELDFSNEALPGHLPSSTILRDTLQKGKLFSRMNACSSTGKPKINSDI